MSNRLSTSAVKLLVFCGLLASTLLTDSGTLYANPEGGKGTISTVSMTMHSDWRKTPKLYIPSGRKKLSGKGVAVASAFLEENKALFKINPKGLKLTSSRQSLLGTHYRYTQYLNDHPVHNSEGFPNLDLSSSELHFLPDI